ncbi:unnamed protein product [Bursaphelenchus okinawaensis]|uniref:ENTH domain-containing protein n=1 Tax=Bursaphelenchus okinawaensis TaxID=465554 RepID=A0A811KJ06_9BILA|nr:unnamed protein product [Bursaphelenchus okinawaensis]CAG9104203.1 unnamed protein product [Bursaphelenchus okinawaensis]
MSISTLRRQVKNVAYNFSDAQVKVREATSNDPWGPTTALMSEIADLTHNPMSFTEIMSMIWKRLNDHGKNWRHVYKSLVLLDYLVKCGSDKVAQQCKENIYSIETLKDFQHIEENRDQGLNVREKAKQMMALLNDEERLKNERARFQMTRKRFAQTGSGIASDGTVRGGRRHDTGAVVDSELEEARPSSIGEEEMQLQIALALSREECEKEEELRKGDAIRLQMALEESKKKEELAAMAAKAPESTLDDLLSLNLGDATAPGPSGLGTSGLNDPWAPVAMPASVTNADPWSPVNKPQVDPLADLLGGGPPAPAQNDPWNPVQQQQEPVAAAVAANPQLNDPWAAFEADSTQNMVATPSPIPQNRVNSKTPESFLGENSSLVNLDNLMGPSVAQNKPAVNPFASALQTSTTPTNTTNPFSAQQKPSPSLNEMMHAQRTGGSNGGATPNPVTNPFA